MEQISPPDEDPGRTSKPEISQEEFWYVGVVSERKAEKILSEQGVTGGFLVRDSPFPDVDYVLSVNSRDEIWHYDIIFLTKEECIFNKYSFPSIPDIINFYTENRLGKVFLEPPEKPILESISKSSDSKIKLAPKSVKPTARFSPIIKKAPPMLINDGNDGYEDGAGNEDISQASSESLAGHADTGVTDNPPVIDDTPAFDSNKSEPSAVPGSSATRQSDEEPCAESDPSTNGNTANDTTVHSNSRIPAIEGTTAHEVQTPGQHEKQPVAPLAAVTTTTRAAPSPATVIRHNSRAKIMSELRRLPSIKGVRTTLARRIQGSDSSESDSDEEQIEKREKDKEVSIKPPPPPLPRRTTPPLNSQKHNKSVAPMLEQTTPQESMMPPTASPTTPTFSPSSTPDFSHADIPPMPQNEVLRIPSISVSEVSEDGSIGEEEPMPPPPPMSTHPEVMKKAKILSQERDHSPIPTTEPQLPVAPTDAATPERASTPLEPQESPKISHEPTNAIGDDENNQEDSMPPPPPMSTHPEVMKASNTLPPSSESPSTVASEPVLPAASPLPVLAAASPSPPVSSPDANLKHAGGHPSEPQSFPEVSLPRVGDDGSSPTPEMKFALRQLLDTSRGPPPALPPQSSKTGSTSPSLQKPVALKRRSIHASTPANRLEASAGRGQEAMPPISDHPEAMKASTLPRSHTHRPIAPKPQPRPRRINAKTTSNPATSDNTASNSSTNESFKSPTPNSSVAATPETAADPTSSSPPPISPQTINHEASPRDDPPAVAMTTTAAAAATTTTTTPPAAVPTMETAEHVPEVALHSHVPKQHLQQQTAGEDVSQGGGENPVLTIVTTPSGSPSHSFLFHTTAGSATVTATAAADSQPPTTEEEGGHLSVSSPTHVESIVKCGPMNTKRSGGTIKKKRSILRRK